MFREALKVVLKNTPKEAARGASQQKPLDEEEDWHEKNRVRAKASVKALESHAYWVNMMVGHNARESCDHALNYMQQKNTDQVFEMANGYNRVFIAETLAMLSFDDQRWGAIEDDMGPR